MSVPEFISQSQAGQDLWIKAILVDAMGIKAGTFLDVGACHPINFSNTFALEQAGWHGLLVDNDPGAAELCAKVRPDASFFRVDATTCNWRGLLPSVFGERKVIDYLSLDVDGATADTLVGLLASGYRFRAATIEHDFYRFGQGPRFKIRAAMVEAGYEIICKDVLSKGCCFEDWWVAPDLVDIKAARYFICSDVDGLVIVSPP